MVAGAETFRAGTGRKIFSLLKTKNVGIMLDTGHLMNTNMYLTDELAGIAYICQVLDKLGDLKHLIKGVHLSCSLSGEYQQQFAKVVPPKSILQHC